jgi:hypothetical protein
MALVLLSVRDAALFVAFWMGYGTGLIRGLTPVLVARVLG